MQISGYKLDRYFLFKNSCINSNELIWKGKLTVRIVSGELTRHGLVLDTN